MPRKRALSCPPPTDSTDKLKSCQRKEIRVSFVVFVVGQHWHHAFDIADLCQSEPCTKMPFCRQPPLIPLHDFTFILGPGQYDLKESANPGGLMTTRQQRFKPKKNENPGPGSYEVS